MKCWEERRGDHGTTVDLATANGPADVSGVDQGREMLRRIAAMLTSLSKVAANDS